MSQTRVSSVTISSVDRDLLRLTLSEIGEIIADQVRKATGAEKVYWTLEEDAEVTTYSGSTKVDFLIRLHDGYGRNILKYSNGLGIRITRSGIEVITDVHGLGGKTEDKIAGIIRDAYITITTRRAVEDAIAETQEVIGGITVSDLVHEEEENEIRLSIEFM